MALGCNWSLFPVLIIMEFHPFIYSKKMPTKPTMSSIPQVAGARGGVKDTEGHQSRGSATFSRNASPVVSYQAALFLPLLLPFLLF